MPEDTATNAYHLKFGASDGAIVEKITHKACNLASQWGMFLYLYCGPKERVDTLFAASDRVARMLQGLLWDDTLLRIRQLTDPGKSRSNANLSLDHLVRIAGDVDLSSELAATKADCTLARSYASKYLAHLDLDHATGQASSRIERGQTTKAVRSICRFVHEFHLRATGTQIDIMPANTIDSEEYFLLRLYQGIEAEQSAEQAARGAASAGDWKASHREEIPQWIWDRGESEGFLDKD